MVDVTYQFTDEHRNAYAAELLREPDPFKAAIALFPDEMGRACWVAANWPSDPAILVITHSLLKNNGIKDFLPTKEAASRRLWEMAQASKDPEDIVKLVKLLADISGWIQKDPGPAINLNVNNNVMVVKEKGASTEEWEKGLRAQQEKLTARDTEETRH